MRVRLIAVGRLKRGPEWDLTERYRIRAVQLIRSIGIAALDTVELPEGRSQRMQDRQSDEADRIREAAAPFGLVVFDELANSATSEDFAGRLRGWRDTGRSGIALAIGGPDGLSDELKAEAEWAVSFGRMTLPHQVVRILAQEQIYRAFTIIAGHPYHRGTGGTR